MDYEQQIKHNTFFDKLAIWDLDGEQKSEAAQTIINDVETGIEYWSQMILSSIIASLGLLINATPVVIGAMLIAPILRPIQGVSFSITTGNRRLFWKSLWLLISSIAIGIISAILITRLIPLSELTNEILMRTQPTLIDLGIAFASGIIAFLAFGYKRISASLAGVAMAASLVPPLAVVGIGIGMLKRQIGRGSWVLFMTNLIAIIIAGVGIFYMFGFSPNQKKELKTSLVTTVFSLAIMLALCVPLAGSLFNIIESIKNNDRIDTLVHSFIHEIDDRITLEGFTHNDETISLKLRAPAEISITNDDKTQLSQHLAQALNKDVAVDMTITPFVTTINKQLETIDPLQKINNAIDTFLATLYPPVTRIETKRLTTNKTVLITEFFTDEQFDTARFKTQLQDYLIEQGNSVDALVIKWQTTHEKSSEQLTAKQSARNTLKETLENSFKNEFPDTYVLSFDLLRGENSNDGIITLVTTTSQQAQDYLQALQDRKNTATKLSQMNITIKSTVQYGKSTEL